MENVCWPYFDPEYESLSQRIHPPMVRIDNDTYQDCSLVMVDSANRHGILLEVVQVLTDLDLIISKAYISSDGGWFMDVFHVTDQLGNKLTDQRIIDYIQQALGAKRDASTTEVRTCLGRTVGVQSIGEHTVIELTGTDRPGLLSEISAVLTNLKSNVVAAEVWTHKMRVACVVYITDELTAKPIEDPERLNSIKEQLSNVLKGNDDRKGVKTDFSMGLTHTERRLHQMMFADRDYEGPETRSLGEDGRPIITIENCNEKGYSVVTVHSKDRPKLLFDTVCTLTDMQYVVFHASINSTESCAVQEYYIRHMDGCTLDTEGEKQRVIKCLEAAIERRVSDGIRLELCTRDRVGLLSDITRIFRENGLSVTRADVTTRGDRAVNVFYVTDASGNPVDMKIVEAIRKEIGHTYLQVKNAPSSPRSCPIDNATEKPRFSFGSLLKSQIERFSYNIGLIRS
uniref:ACT domain-containing protein n=1 Tax=Araucaria cunninghamii TaxID=56994 RepID=A0A0D6QYN3_ARACU